MGTGLPSRPTTRAGCATVPRPCPFASCRYSLLEFAPDGAAPSPTASCALDLAERGGLTATEVAVVVGLSRSRVQQIERVALVKLKALTVRDELHSDQAPLGSPPRPPGRRAARRAGA